MHWQGTLGLSTSHLTSIQFNHGFLECGEKVIHHYSGHLRIKSELTPAQCSMCVQQQSITTLSSTLATHQGSTAHVLISAMVITWNSREIEPLYNERQLFDADQHAAVQVLLRHVRMNRLPIQLSIILVSHLPHGELAEPSTACEQRAVQCFSVIPSHAVKHTSQHGETE